MDPPINELVNTIERMNPALLVDLARDFPELAERDLLRGGKKMGGSKKVVEPTAGEILRMKGEVAQRAVPALKERCTRGIQERTKALARASSLLLIAQICTCISGLGLLALIAKPFPDAIQYVTSALVGVSTLATIVSQYVTRNRQQQDKGVIGEYIKLVELNAKAEALVLKIDLWRATGYRDESGASAIAEMNDLAYKVALLVHGTAEG